MSTSPTWDGNILNIFIRLALLMFCDILRFGVEELANGDGVGPFDDVRTTFVGGPSLEEMVMEFPPIA